MDREADRLRGMVTRSARGRPGMTAVSKGFRLLRRVSSATIARRICWPAGLLDMMKALGCALRSTVCVRAIIFFDGVHGLVSRLIRDECYSLRATGTIIPEVELDDGGNLRKEVLDAPPN
jgi:hypothetical protein